MQVIDNGLGPAISRRSELKDHAATVGAAGTCQAVQIAVIADENASGASAVATSCEAVEDGLEPTSGGDGAQFKDGALLLSATGVRDAVQISHLVENETIALPCVGGSGKTIERVLRPTTGASEAGGRRRPQAENQTAVLSLRTVVNASVRVAVENPVRAEDQPVWISSLIATGKVV